ncbi:hypothetical protein [Gephyromycinifex aptenodytis]|uniref:hypothetical protein n=1 Tax=Gephyromycinifex aptenodytis TaxID=2716227 RepID=UPI0014463ED8|nr:hypothetical protein [Gephyromycinifex aptenodytis]
MSALHLGLLAASVSLVGITAATSESLRRRESTLPALGYVVGTGLSVGNAACLLPSTPLWYSALLVPLSVAGMLWFLASVASARPSRLRTAHSVHTTGNVPTVVQGSVRKPVPLHVVRDTSPQPAIEPPREPVSATQQTFAEAGPAHGWAAAGQGPYVAAHIERYVDARGTRRAHGSYGPRRHTGEDPTARFLKLARAYGVDHPGRPGHSGSSGRSYRA